MCIRFSWLGIADRVKREIPCCVSGSCVIFGGVWFAVLLCMGDVQR